MNLNEPRFACNCFKRTRSFLLLSLGQDSIRVLGLCAGNLLYSLEMKSFHSRVMCFVVHEQMEYGGVQN